MKPATSRPWSNYISLKPSKALWSPNSVNLRQNIVRQAPIPFVDAEDNGLDILSTSEVFYREIGGEYQMPSKKKKPARGQRPKNAMTLADIKRAKRMHKDLQLKLKKIQNEINEMMGHIPHCP